MDGCDQVALNLLNVVESPPYIANVAIEGECGNNCDHDQHMMCLPDYETNYPIVKIVVFRMPPSKDRCCNPFPIDISEFFVSLNNI